MSFPSLKSVFTLSNRDLNPGWLDKESKHVHHCRHAVLVDSNNYQSSRFGLTHTDTIAAKVSVTVTKMKTSFTSPFRSTDGSALIFHREMHKSNSGSLTVT